MPIDQGALLRALNDNLTVNGPQWRSNPSYMKNAPLETDMGHMYKHLYEPKTTQFNPPSSPLGPTTEKDIMDALRAGGNTIGMQLPGKPTTYYNTPHGNENPNMKMSPQEIAYKNALIQQQMQAAQQQLNKQAVREVTGGPSNLLGNTGGGSIKMPWERDLE